jgi:hypothetical protein
VSRYYNERSRHFRRTLPRVTYWKDIVAIPVGVTEMQQGDNGDEEIQSELEHFEF